MYNVLSWIVIDVDIYMENNLFMFIELEDLSLSRRARWTQGSHPNVAALYISRCSERS